MKNQRKPPRPRTAKPAALPVSRKRGFDPVAPRPRHDGWTPDKQAGFIDALAESGCVTEAAARVGMSAGTAYALRRRPDAESFRMAWEAALDHAVVRLSDAAFSRALSGVARPVFFQGEQVGERRYYDERLTMFILRYRDPVRYGAWLDSVQFDREPDAAAHTLARWRAHVREDAVARMAGLPRPCRTRPGLRQLVDPDTAAAEREAREEARFDAIRRNEFNAWLRGDLVPPDEEPGDGPESGGA